MSNPREWPPSAREDFRGDLRGRKKLNAERRETEREPAATQRDFDPQRVGFDKAMAGVSKDPHDGELAGAPLRLRWPVRYPRRERFFARFGGSDKRLGVGQVLAPTALKSLSREHEIGASANMPGAAHRHHAHVDMRRGSEAGGRRRASGNASAQS